MNVDTTKAIVTLKRLTAISLSRRLKGMRMPLLQHRPYPVTLRARQQYILSNRQNKMGNDLGKGAKSLPRVTTLSSSLRQAGNTSALLGIACRRGHKQLMRGAQLGLMADHKPRLPEQPL